MKNVVYMEVDLSDGLYKASPDVINQNDHFLGELVISSNENKPHSKYFVKANYLDKIVYDSVVQVGRYKRGYLFELVFSESKIPMNSAIYFYTKRIFNIDSRFPYSWVLQESTEASLILDKLELKYAYNPLGNTLVMD